MSCAQDGCGRALIAVFAKTSLYREARAALSLIFPEISSTVLQTMLQRLSLRAGTGIVAGMTTERISCSQENNIRISSGAGDLHPWSLFCGMC